MTTERKTRTVAAVITALLIASLFSSIYFYRSRSVLSNDLRTEQLNTEKLLGEKSFLEKTIEDFKQQLSSLKGDNANLNSRISETEKIFAEKESYIRKLKA